MTSVSTDPRSFRVVRLTALCGVLVLAGTACDSETGGQPGSDAAVATGGKAAGGGAGSGATSSSGGAVGSGGSSMPAGTGGVSGTGGKMDAGAAGAGGGVGGRSGTGGSTSSVPPSGTGGRPDSGVGSGGAGAAGGIAGSTTSVGGAPGKGGQLGSGGASGSGGARDGGAGAPGTGGTVGTGGSTSTGPCTPAWEDPPSNVSAWINESWNSQLGANVKSRKAWLLDSVMLGKGQINLCVRWGATTAPTADVKKNMASSVEKWFNDWFSKLADYGCFPHSHITAKVTGWAVRPGNESWVSDLDSGVKVYTQTDSGTDPPGEPMCPSACSFFDNWTHKFPNCPGGEDFHTDYWLWLDDKLPGGGAAAVGGDWGLRMPVSNFVASMGKSNLVIEHEMGHGFGFQDYYDWTGSTPSGGSLMIVGSTSNQSPTIADQWLLRRTWKEMKTLRSW